MQHLSSPKRPSAALLLLPLVSVLGCRPSDHGTTGPTGPAVYGELESNDTEFQANYMGTLLPGDHFFIDGHITDIPYNPFDPFNGHDPFDGFSFTTGVPIHVEFTLSAWNNADLDICVYDPQIGLDVACYQTAVNPEFGAIDIFAGNYDFHLVVESFIGIDNYSLEIEVFGLFPATESGSEGSAVIQATEAPAIAAGGGSSGASRSSNPLLGYKHAEPVVEEPEPVLVQRYTFIQIDPVTGATESLQVDRFAKASE